MFRLPGLLIVAAAWVSTPVSAEVYKWIDKDGVVNYSSTPPKSIPAKTVNQDQISIVPLAPPLRASNPREQALRLKVDRLEQELDRERRYDQGSTVVPYSERQDEAFRRWQEQCRTERRVDCDRDTYFRGGAYGAYGSYGSSYGSYGGYGGYGGYGYPRAVIGRAPALNTVPARPVAPAGAPQSGRDAAWAGARKQSVQ